MWVSSNGEMDELLVLLGDVSSSAVIFLRVGMFVCLWLLVGSRMT